MRNIFERPERPRSHNRIAALMIHSTGYAMKGQVKLAKNVGVSKSTICRLVNGRTNPSFSLAAKVARALAEDLGCPLDLNEVFSSDGNYPTPWVCKLVGCKGCLPDRSYASDGSAKEEWQGRQHSWTGDNQELRTVSWPLRGEVQ